MKLGKLASPEFKTAIENFRKNKMPAKLSYKIVGIMRLAAEKAADFEESRKDLVQKYAIKDEKGEIITAIVEGNQIVNIVPELLKEFNQNMYDLATIEVAIEPVHFEEYFPEDKNPLMISPEEMDMLEFLVP